MPTTQSKRDYYEVLGVERSATRDQISRPIASLPSSAIPIGIRLPTPLLQEFSRLEAERPFKR